MLGVHARMRQGSRRSIAKTFLRRIPTSFSRLCLRLLARLRSAGSGFLPGSDLPTIAAETSVMTCCEHGCSNTSAEIGGVKRGGTAQQAKCFRYKECNANRSRLNTALNHADYADEYKAWTPRPELYVQGAQHRSSQQGLGRIINCHRGRESGNKQSVYIVNGRQLPR